MNNIFSHFFDPQRRFGARACSLACDDVSFYEQHRLVRVGLQGINDGCNALALWCPHETTTHGIILGYTAL
jgi:hypothetical protein